MSATGNASRQTAALARRPETAAGVRTALEPVSRGRPIHRPWFAKPGRPRFWQSLVVVAGHYRPAAIAGDDFRPETAVSAWPTVVAACSEPKTNLITGPMVGATDGPMK